MTTIRKDGYVFSVDIEKTKEYYKTHSLCECVNCRNYYAQVKDKFPLLNTFLSEFGVDVSKPDEAWSVESENSSIDYINVDYTVCGKVEAMGEYEIDIHDGQFLNIVITDGFVSPNEQTGEYFTISVMNINLGWALDEPFPKPIKFPATTKKKTDKKQNRIFRIFTRKNKNDN